MVSLDLLDLQEFLVIQEDMEKQEKRVHQVLLEHGESKAL